jgi:hypothetical protein
MEAEFVPYEQALALKELGFDESCFGYFDPLLGDYTIINSDCINPKPTLFNHNSSSIVVSAPTFSQAFRFFREKYNLHSTIALISNSDTERRYMVMIDYIYPHKAIMEFEEYETHEEAELECLKKLIEIVKNK